MEEKLERSRKGDFSVTGGGVESVSSAFENLSSKDGWLNPIAMSILKRAVLTDRAQRVTLNGVEFYITYDEYFQYPRSGREECVKLTRVDGGLVPFGWIMLKTLREFTMEGTNEAS